MKLTTSILTLIFFCNSVFAADSQIKDLVKTFDVNKGTELNAKINPGDITVETWESNQVKVVARGLRADDFDDVSMEMMNNRLIVDFDDRSGNNDVEFIFTVPVNFHMSLSTTGGDIKINDKIIGRVSINTSGGNITTQDMQGTLSCSTMGGDIKLGNINGELNASTQGGDIKVGSVTGKSNKVNTMGGDITVKNSEGSLSAKTYGGDIKIGDIGGNASAVTYGGDIDLGNVSGGVSMETYGGDLSLESASGTVNADTKGGDIKLNNIVGNVEVSTAGGDIKIELTPSESGESSIKTSGGDIELRIPENAKVEIEAEIRLYGDARGKTDRYKITSDFLDLDSQLSDDGKWIRSTYKSGGGGHKIELKTNMSDIKINKQK
jgi:DUF4097 and DUF4098 domain-containing protein YvlB